MEHLLNEHAKNIQISGIRKFFNLVADKKDVISLTIGQPDFQTPNHVKEAGKAAIDQNFTTYTHNAGMLSLREAIRNFIHEKYELNYDPETEIIATVGASQAIDITFRTVLRPGDEVILPGPIYPGYEPLIRLAGATPIFADTTKTNFKVTAELLNEYITPKTKCIVLPYPSNPTGVSLTRGELKEIVDVLKGKPIFVLADEIYSELSYETEHVSIGTFPELRGQTIIVQGLSKSHSMTGWRIGYLLAPKNIAKHILKVHQYNVSCPSSISQYAALEALKNGKEDPIEMKKEYKKRMEFVYDSLLSMGLNPIKPDGAFYIFPKFPIEKMTSFELGIDLVEKVGLALVPGDAFSSLGQGYMRLSYAYNFETLKKGMERLETYLQNESLK
ncbi:aminotransferase [Salirhabdus euzebyi]|uniref:Aminotransferase n=1 Tax=Salirhabdus euzebyi TaxID=394506 RepID=A0A841Q8V9_9BACI|nr:aminotransferase A [Salirhabdus euzebyi]MBB6454840.1 aminotransferase [Salirhabdus euzebyi]